MNSNDNLSNWNFLLGKWESDPASHVGDSPGIINKIQIKHYPSDKYLFMEHQAWKEGKLDSEGLVVLFYDVDEQKYKMKALYGMGFVNNYLEFTKTDHSISFDTTTDSKPKEFGNSEFKYHLAKIEENKIKFTLEMTTDGKTYMKFWEAIYDKRK